MQPSSKKQKVDNSPTKSTSTTKSDPNLIVLDGESLTIESLIKLQQPNTKASLEMIEYLVCFKFLFLQLLQFWEF